MTAHKVLLTGFTGQVGSELKKLAPSDFEIILTQDESGNRLDLRDTQKLVQIVRKTKPTIILNPAGYTAVDKAESEQENARLLNETVPQILATEAKALNALLVHYSTDYVFNGDPTHGPWSETDAPAPLNVYGKTKLAGEKAIQEIWGKHLIFRTSWVFSSHGHNFMKTMLRLAGEREQLKVVHDQVGAPTSAKFLARMTYSAVLAALKDERKCGLYHLTCSDKTSWHGFTQAIIQNAKERGASIKVQEITPISSSEFPTPAERPKNSVMNCQKFATAFGVTLEPWSTALQETITEYISMGPV